MSKNVSLHLARLVCLCLVLLPIATFCQDLASIVGTVTDPSGAAVPEANITITNQNTGDSRTAVTNPSGSYSVLALPIGTYSVRAERAGFQAYVQSGIRLNIRDVVRVDVRLELGQVTSEITVQATGSQVKLQTESAEVANLITSREITEIASNGRNFLQLAALVPGASSNLPSFNVPVPVTSSREISFNGHRSVNNIWYLDGQENYDRGCGGCPNFLPSTDAIAEFKVQASNMSSDTGFGTGGQVQVEIKSGTQTFHGMAYEFLRNDAVDATAYFANLGGGSKPPLKYNNYGYNLGGPFYIPGHYNTNKSKTFFFWSQEWRVLRQGSTIYAPAAPEAWRSGNLSSYAQPILDHTLPVTLPDGTTGYTPFSGNVIPEEQIDSNALILAAPDFILSLPNTSDGRYYAASPSVPTNVREEIIRVDHQISDKTSLMFRYMHEQIENRNATTLWNSSTYPTLGSVTRNVPQALVLKLTRSMSPTLLNEFMFSYARQPLFIDPTGTFARPSDLTIPTLSVGNEWDRIPAIALSGQALGVGYTAGSYPFFKVGNFWTARDQVSTSYSNHTLKAGFEFYRFLGEQQIFGTTQGSFTFDGSATAGNYLGTDGQIHATGGNEFADFLLGQAKSYNVLLDKSAPAYISNKFAAWFGDTWKIRPGFSLDYGLRWEYMPHAFEVFDRIAAFRPALYDPSQAPQFYPGGSQIVPDTGDRINGMALAGKNGIPRGLVTDHWPLFQPRVGFAWKPFGAEKTVVRAGYGIFYESIQGNDVYNIAPNPPFSETLNIYNTLLSNPGGVPGAIFPTSTQNYDPEYIMPSSHQFSFGVQNELNPRTVLSVMYVGSKGTHLQINRNINQPLAPAGSANVDTVRPYLGYGNIGWYENSTSSSYHSLQVHLRTNEWHGLTSGVAYTWSHFIDFASSDVPGFIQNAYDVGAERGNSDYDRRHMVIINYIYDLPFFRDASKLTGKLLGGWELSGVSAFQTGLPLTITFPGDPAQVGSAPYRANLIGDPNSGTVHTRERWFSPDAFGPVATGSFGNAGRNVARGQGLNNWDISIFKNFRGIPFPGAKEGANVQFRAEFFNAWNHTQFNGYFLSFGSTGFGGANSTRDPRILQFGLKFVF